MLLVEYEQFLFQKYKNKGKGVSILWQNKKHRPERNHNSYVTKEEWSLQKSYTIYLGEGIWYNLELTSTRFRKNDLELGVTKSSTLGGTKVMWQIRMHTNCEIFLQELIPSSVNTSGEVSWKQFLGLVFLDSQQVSTDLDN